MHCKISKTFTLVIMKFSILLIVFCCLFSACSQPRIQLDVRTAREQPFAEGTHFAIATTAYLEKYGQRISWYERTEIDKKIIAALQLKGFIYDPSADLVINYYREHYDFARDGVYINTVTVQHQRKKYRYTYTLNADSMSNDRDGALVIDIYDMKQQACIQQALLTYYFSSLHAQYRESRDDIAPVQARLIEVLSELFVSE